MLYAACHRVGTLAYATVAPRHVPEASHRLPKSLAFITIISPGC